MIKILDRISNSRKGQMTLDKEEIAKILKTNPEALKKFEDIYHKNILGNDQLPENLFDINSKQAASLNNQKTQDIEISDDDREYADILTDRIVDELLSQTTVYKYVGSKEKTKKFDNLIDTGAHDITNSDISRLPLSLQPQLTGNLIRKDYDMDSYPLILFYYKKALEGKNIIEKENYYNHFRQGLDILDLDPITYEIIGKNMNSIGNWFPQLVSAAKKQNFFRLPDTTIIKVPITLLQLTRQDYMSLTPTTLKIVDRYCYKAFELDENKDYFIKTGTYSSKYDFRNAHVTGTKEVRELGEYLLFIHFQALQMASPLCKPSIYGVSTTNEWVVREFIRDKENNPCIYKGLPLRTEYRIFVDFDKDEIIGANPYWDPEVMKQRFGHEKDSDSPHQLHDYVIYQMHEEKLMQRYNDHIKTVKENLLRMIPDIDLNGQWSIDIMENGDEFYIIDMALAQNSALIKCVPIEKRRQLKEDWIPKLEI